MKKELDNISYVYKKGLCCSCTMCSNYCKHGAISFEIDNFGFYKPIVDNNKCVGCRICLNSCPGINDLKNYIERDEHYCYGYSNDSEMRLNSASGGLTTELLCHLLVNKVVDYVTVVTNRVNGKLPLQILTDNLDIVRQCRTSKYCPVNCDNILRDIEMCNGSVAFVGLPCQVNSISEYFRKRKNCKIKFFISLMCNHVPSFNAANYLALLLDKNERLESIMNRGGGWPGFMTLMSKSGKIYKLPFRKTWPCGYGVYFKNDRCELCNDPFSKYADIVLGDSYFLQDSDTKGHTFAIVRNSDLFNYLNDMNTKEITLYNGPKYHIIRSYFSELFRREKYFVKKNAMYKILYGENIHMNKTFDKPKISLGDIIEFWILLFKNKLGRFHWIWKLLSYRHHSKKLIIKL